MASDPLVRQWTVSPGEVLLEALEERGMSQSELARRMGRPVKTINEIVNAKAALTPETALQLEMVLEMSASLWTQLEATYRQELARQRVEQSLSQEGEWLRSFPLAELARRHIIDSTLSVGEQVAQVLRFFGLGSVQAWNNRWLVPDVQFRRSPTFAGSPQSRAVWLRLGDRLSTELDLKAYRPERLLAVMDELRAVTRIAPMQAAVEDAQELLAEAGVALVLVPELPKTTLSGAARWMADGRPLIQLSARHRTDDHLWFSLFHEIGHLLDQPNQDFLDASDIETFDPAEARADRFARDQLIDPDELATFRQRGQLDSESVRDFARQRRVAPGVVVGRLQHDGDLGLGQLNHLKRPVKLAE